MAEKVIRDGKVAVLVSPEFGAGWSTWADNAEVAMFDPEVVAWVERGEPRDEFLEKEESWLLVSSLNNMEAYFAQQEKALHEVRASLEHQVSEAQLDSAA